ncbi:hypothetical protein [Brevibacillus borstelensis]|uniref:hypothetical protein n=1 Tax=Brevibacillus borstelensis TaxID=45462 RepID=UPI0030BEACE1
MKKKQWIIIAVLLILLAAGFAVRSLTAIPLAEGYLYEDENRVLYAKVIPDKENVAVEIQEAKVETIEDLPAVTNATHMFTGTLKEGNLTLTTKEGQAVTATVTRDELVFHGPWMDAYEPETKLLGTPKTAYEEKLTALSKRVSERAEAIQKQRAEQKAKEAAELAKKVEQLTKLQADIAENVKYLSELHFSEDQAIYEQHLADMQALSEEITTVGQDEGAALVETMVGSMNTLMDGVNVLHAKIDQKAKSITNIIEVMQGDLNQAQVLWSQVKERIENKDKEYRSKAYDEVVKAGTEAIGKAKEELAVAKKMLNGYKSRAEGYHQKAQAH